mgnify:CR=1 FL=1
MKVKIHLVFLVLIFGIQMMSAQELDKIIFQKVDSLLEDVFHRGIYTGQVIISHQGEEVYYKQNGYADWHTSRTMDKNTLFNIGSLNKQFTEEIIHQLVEEHKLNYQDKISKYLNLFPEETGNKITILQLIDMKAGLGDYLRNPKFRMLSEKDFSVSELVDIIKDEPLLYEPGTGQEYSNSGYVVLGALIEKISGKSYEENLKERIFKPLGLGNVYYTKEQKSKQVNRAHGHLIDFDGNKESMDDISCSTPAGGLYMNIGSLLKFVEAKRQGHLPSGKKYGSGMFAGGTEVWNSSIFFHEKSGFCFVVLANTGDIADELAPRISSILKGEPIPPVELPFNLLLYKLIQEKGIDYVKNNVEKLAMQARLPYDDRFLNYFGYQFLKANKIDLAINLFEINVSLFPKVPNTYDSLAEAYLVKGDKTNALKYYKMEAEMIPENKKLKALILDLEN